MQMLKSFAVWTVLLAVLYAAGQVVAAEGWAAGGVFLLALTLFFGFVGGLADLLAAPFRRSRPD